MWWKMQKPLVGSAVLTLSTRQQQRADRSMSITAVVVIVTQVVFNFSGLQAEYKHILEQLAYFKTNLVFQMHWFREKRRLRLGL